MPWSMDYDQVISTHILSTEKLSLSGSPLHKEDRENGPTIPCQRKGRESGHSAETLEKHREFCLLKL